MPAARLPREFSAPRGSSFWNLPFALFGPQAGRGGRRRVRGAVPVWGRRRGGQGTRSPAVGRRRSSPSRSLGRAACPPLPPFSGPRPRGQVGARDCTPRGLSVNSKTPAGAAEVCSSGGPKASSEVSPPSRPGPAVAPACAPASAAPRGRCYALTAPRDLKCGWAWEWGLCVNKYIRRTGARKKGGCSQDWYLGLKPQSLLMIVQPALQTGYVRDAGKQENVRISGFLPHTSFSCSAII